MTTTTNLLSSFAQPAFQMISSQAQPQKPQGQLLQAEPLPDLSNLSAALLGKQDGLSVDQLASKLRALCGNADLAFVVFAMQIEQLNSSVSEKIKGIQQTSETRETINADLTKVRDLLGQMGADDKLTVDDFAKQQGLEKPKDPGPEPLDDGTETDEHTDWVKAKGQYDEHLAAYNLSLKGVEQPQIFANEYSMKDGEVAVQTGKALFKETDGKITYEKATLEAEEKRLQGKLETLDSDREIAMISLNADISKKGQFVEWLSNMMKRSGDTKSSVISNLR